MLFVIRAAVCIILTISANAAIIDAIQPPSVLQIPFYKTKESKFPSGYTSLDNLKKKQLGHSLQPEKYYRHDSKLYHTQELFPIFPIHLAKSVIEAKSKKRFIVKETNVASLLVQDPSVSKGSFKYSSFDLSSDPYDLGYAMTLKDIYIKSEANKNSKILTTIPQAQRLQTLQYQNGFAKVNYKQYTGYVSLSEIITKFDFALYAYDGKKWHSVKSRNFDYLINEDNEKIHLSKVQGLIVNDLTGIIGSNSQKVPLWSRVQLVDNSLPEWAQSKLQDHGFVWWRPIRQKVDTIYSIDELLKKEIASVSFNPKNPLQGVLSSHGVYITENGQQWKKVDRFDDFHGPVHYFSPALIFVGNFRSIDGGKTFDNYIQLDRLAHTIEDQYGFLPKKLQVKKIETFEPYRMKIEIDTGTRKLKLESPLFAQEWRPFKG